MPRHRPLPRGELAALLRRRLRHGLTGVRCFAHAAPALAFSGMRLTRAPFLHVMLAGRLRVRAPDGAEVGAGPGEGLFFAAGTYVNLVFPGACRYFRATLTPRAVFFGEVEILGPGPGGPGDDPRIRGGCMRAHVLPGPPGPAAEALVDVLTRLAGRRADSAASARDAAALTTLLHEWLDALAEATDGPDAHRESLLSLRALQFMEEHAHRPINRATVAAALDVSAEHLTRVLRRDTGRGPLEHLHALRHARALELLADPALPLEEVAVRAGFTSRSYFTQVFTRRTGRSPRDFRAGT